MIWYSHIFFLWLKIGPLRHIGPIRHVLKGTVTSNGRIRHTGPIRHMTYSSIWRIRPIWRIGPYDVLVPLSRNRKFFFAKFQKMRVLRIILIETSWTNEAWRSFSQKLLWIGRSQFRISYFRIIRILRREESFEDFNWVTQ